MTSKVFVPNMEDIWRHIYEFDPTYREFFSLCVEELQWRTLLTDHFRYYPYHREYFNPIEYLEMTKREIQRLYSRLLTSGDEYDVSAYNDFMTNNVSMELLSVINAYSSSSTDRNPRQFNGNNLHPDDYTALFTVMVKHMLQLIPYLQKVGVNTNCVFDTNCYWYAERCNYNDLNTVNWCYASDNSASGVDNVWHVDITVKMLVCDETLEMHQWLDDMRSRHKENVINSVIEDLEAEFNKPFTWEDDHTTIMAHQYYQWELATECETDSEGFRHYRRPQIKYDIFKSEKYEIYTYNFGEIICKIKNVTIPM